jgi:hypothetical protein
MELTRTRGIPHYDYTSEDLSADLADLDEVELLVRGNDALLVVARLGT